LRKRLGFVAARLFRSLDLHHPVHDGHVDLGRGTQLAKLFGLLSVNATFSPAVMPLEVHPKSLPASRQRFMLFEAEADRKFPRFASPGPPRSRTARPRPHSLYAKRMENAGKPDRVNYGKAREVGYLISWDAAERIGYFLGSDDAAR
jgi:hypothetical protein